MSEITDLNRKFHKGKISILAGLINNQTDIKKALQGINILDELRDVSKLDLKAGNFDIPKVKINKKEPIEYVVKEEKQEISKIDLKAGNLDIPKVKIDKNEKQNDEMEL